MRPGAAGRWLLRAERNALSVADGCLPARCKRPPPRPTRALRCATGQPPAHEREGFLATLHVKGAPALAGRAIGQPPALSCQRDGRSATLCGGRSAYGVIPISGRLAAAWTGQGSADQTDPTRPAAAAARPYCRFCTAHQLPAGVVGVRVRREGAGGLAAICTSWAANEPFCLDGRRAAERRRIQSQAQAAPIRRTARLLRCDGSGCVARPGGASSAVVPPAGWIPRCTLSSVKPRAASDSTAHFESARWAIHARRGAPSWRTL